MKNHTRTGTLNITENNIYLNLICSILLAVLLPTLISCGKLKTPPIEEDDDKSITSFLTVSCENLSCSIDTSETYTQNGDVATHTCDMDDGTNINIFTLEPTYDYTFTEPGTYTIRCSVSSSTGESDTNSVTVTVGGVFADAGPDQVVNAGDTVFLDGSASTVGAGESITYLWTKWSTTTVSNITLDDRNAERPSFLVPLDGVGQIKYSLTVSNGTKGSPPDYVVIQVNATDFAGTD